MATYNYTSATDFNQDLPLHVVEVVGDRKTETRYSGFTRLRASPSTSPTAERLTRRFVPP